MKPRFGFRTRGFPGLTVEQAATELARLGYDCIEICLEEPDVRPEMLDERRCSEIRTALDELGIGLASVSYHGDKEPPAARLANQERAVRVASWLRADTLVINTERSVEQDRQWKEHVGHFRKLCELAGEDGVNLAVEPEPLLVVGSSQDMVEMLRAVDSPWLRVNFDVGHAQMTDEHPAASIHRLGSAIVHVHLEDIKDKVHRHLPFGEGDMDFASVRQALAEIGYNGPYVVDLVGLADPSDSARHALSALQRLFA